MTRVVPVAVAAALAAGCMAVLPSGAAPISPPAPTEELGATYNPRMGFADLVDSVSPAVVNVKVASVGAAPQIPPGFRQFFDVPSQPRVRKGEGSGFIISDDGLVLSNAHVVQGATNVSVVLTDGREVPVKVLGSDASMDIALLQLPSDESWPHLALGNSDEVRVGDWALALGNGLGLGQTATVGIISGKGRVLGHDVFGNEDFLQTDAAINQGNSGGPLFNLRGQVVGMNTAIIAGANTVGFSIPSNLIQSVLDDLKTEGRVARGFLGVAPQALTPELASALGIRQKEGAVISKIYNDTPAQEYGMQLGDVVVAVDGDPIEDSVDLVRTIGNHRPGDEVMMEVWRKGSKQKLKVTLADRPGERRPSEAPQSTGEITEKLGLGLAPLTPSMAAEQRVGEGVVVESVARGSAADGRLRAGDIITQMNRRSVSSPSDIEALLARSRGQVSFLVVRGEVQLFVPVSIP